MRMVSLMRLLALFMLAGLGLAFAASSADDCFRISAPGTYVLTDDVYGADYDIGGYGYDYACVVINSSDVVFDCDSYSILGYGDYYGIYIANSASGMLDNITIRNCDISNYYYGIYSHMYAGDEMSGSTFANNTMGNYWMDIYAGLMDGGSIEGNEVANGFLLNSMSGMRISGNAIGSGSYCEGLLLSAINDPDPPYGLMHNVGLDISGNTVTGCDNGYEFYYMQNSTVTGNLAAENYNDGFFFSETGMNNVTGNIARNNSVDSIFSAGFETYGEGDLFYNNTAENNSNGFDVFYGGNTFRGNRAFHNYFGMNLEYKADGNVLDGNTFEENVYADMLVAGNARELSFDDGGCANTVINTTGSGGRPIFYSNETVSLNGGTYSEVILCGAEDSVLDGVTVRGSDTFKNNGFVLMFADGSEFRNLVSDGNALGVWLYGTDDASVTGGHAAGNYIGYLVTYSKRTALSGMSAYGNNGTMPGFFGGKSFFEMMPLGAGVFEMTMQPRQIQLEGPSMAAPAQSMASNNTYGSLRLYGNNYGMGFVMTSNATVSFSDIHDNALCGILDGAGSEDDPAAVTATNTQLYRNGRDFISLLMGMGGGQIETGPMQTTIGQTGMPQLPEGILWVEYAQMSLLLQQIFSSEASGMVWRLDDVRHGTGTPSALLSAEDGAEAAYFTSETDLPARDSFVYSDGYDNRTVFLNLTPPENKAPVGSKYFSIMAMADAGSECETYCGYGCYGDGECYYYDDFGYCNDCKDSNQNRICDDFECLDVDPVDGECDNECTDLDQNGMCDTCDPVLPAIDEFSVSWASSEISGYDPATMELYYLDLTSREPAFRGSQAPTNQTISGEWVPVPGQVLDGNRISVEGLSQPEADYLSQLLGIPYEMGLYQGIYGLFAERASTGGDDSGQPKPEKPVQNGTAPECTSDDQCAVNELCAGGKCERFPCECGEYLDHGCAEFACCSDTDCAEGEFCFAHACQKEKPQYECTADSMCAGSEYCKIPAGSEGGTCEPVGANPCGEIRDHAFVPYGYECGSEEGCPSCPEGEACLKHACVQADVSCPSTGIVGDSKTCEAKEEGEICPACDYEVTSPDGRKSYGKTDDNGNFQLPLGMKGTYLVALLKDGQPVRTIKVQAFPQAEPAEPEKPTAGGLDAGPLLFVAVLLIAILAGLVYWRSRGTKRK